ncbi:MAG TPA: hypothetical protein VFA11_10050 [Acidimicrobiales bacterium]|nr:hypothetical protein [Acidimicrobiales bacterium]
MADATDPSPAGAGMGRVNLTAPQELLERAKARGLNLSELFRSAVREALGPHECDHQRAVVCSDCGRELVGEQLAERAVTRLYLDVLDAIAELVHQGGTAEGAGRVVRDVGRRLQLRAALEAPIPRATRAERRQREPLPPARDTGPLAGSTSAEAAQ